MRITPLEIIHHRIEVRIAFYNLYAIFYVCTCVYTIMALHELGGPEIEANAFFPPFAGLFHDSPRFKFSTRHASHECFGR